MDSKKKYYYVMLKNVLDINDSKKITIYCEEVNNELVEILTGKKVYIVTDDFQYDELVNELNNNNYSYIGLFKSQVTPGLISSHLSFMTESSKKDFLESLSIMEFDIKKMIRSYKNAKEKKKIKK